MRTISTIRIDIAYSVDLVHAKCSTSSRTLRREGDGALTGPQSSCPLVPLLPQTDDLSSPTLVDTSTIHFSVSCTGTAVTGGPLLVLLISQNISQPAASCTAAAAGRCCSAARAPRCLSWRGAGCYNDDGLCRPGTNCRQGKPSWGSPGDGAVCCDGCLAGSLNGASCH
eukprot:COSAG05_NODE_13_length_36464_cov_294.169449_4_plen_169_part_00